MVLGFISAFPPRCIYLYPDLISFKTGDMLVILAKLIVRLSLVTDGIVYCLFVCLFGSNVFHLRL